MPMIDVYAPDDLLPSGSDRNLGEQLTLAILRAEGVTKPAAFHLDNTAAFIHRMDSAAVQTAARGNARAVRVQIITPPGALTRNGQKRLVGDATRIVAEVCGDPTQAQRTWVLLTEAPEGGWGINGTAYGRGEFRGAGEARVKVILARYGCATETVCLGQRRQCAHARVSRSRMGCADAR